VTEVAAARMGRTLQTDDLPGLLHRNREHPRWDEVGSRCLTCTNCTMVCPTCFCHDLTDGISLDGAEATREREWASCFGEEFTHMSFGEVRSSNRSRYRQWLTHKFDAWHLQFGTSGCVGCGRCITWCPVGIDVTEEIAAIRMTDGEVRVAEEVLA
jgi:sulfhydrogenase subunit beta (sulfur reductase)